MPGFLLRLESTSPAGRISTVSAMDPPTDARPSRTPARGGIPPRYQQVELFTDDGFPVTLSIWAGVVLAGSLVWGPTDAQAWMNGRVFSRFWSETPDMTPPVITQPSGSISSRIELALQPWHVGAWRLAWRFHGSGLDSGAVMLPFVVKLTPAT